MEEFFHSNSSEDQKTAPNIIQRSDADYSQINGDADVDHSQIIGGMQSNYWWGYIPPSPRVSAPLVANSGSKSKIHGPKRFITVTYASCVKTVRLVHRLMEIYVE